MNRYILLPLVLLISSSGYGMQKMERKNWVQQPDGKFLAVEDQVLVVADQVCPSYQNPLIMAETKRINGRETTIYKFNRQPQKPIHDLMWTKERIEGQRTIYYEKPDTEVSEPLHQKALAINTRLNDIKDAYIKRKAELEVLQQAPVPKDTKRTADFARLLLQKEENFSDVKIELLRRKVGKETAIVALHQSLESSKVLEGANENRLATLTSRLETKKRELEDRKARIEEKQKLKTGTTTGKRTMLNGTLVAADTLVAEQAREQALAEQFSQTNTPVDRSKTAREIIAQEQRVQSSRQQLEDRIKGREEEIIAIDSQINELNQINKALIINQENMSKRKSELVAQVDALENWLTNPKPEHTPRRSWLSWWQ